MEDVVSQSNVTSQENVKLGNFEALWNSIIENINDKKFSKLQTLFKELYHYDLSLKRDVCDVEVFLPMLTGTEDKKLLRSIYYFIMQLSPNESKNIRQALTKEIIGQKDIGRRVLSLRCLSYQDGDLLVNSSIMETISTVLRTTANDDSKDKDKKTKRKFFSKGNTGSEDRIKGLLQYACFLSCRIKYDKVSSLTFNCIEGMKSNDPIAARHAVALLLPIAKEEPEVVSEGVLRFVVNSKEREDINNEDFLCRLYFVQLCSILCPIVDNQNKDYLRYLCASLGDKHYRVSFEVIHQLAILAPKLGWDQIASIVVQVEDQDVNIIDLIIKKIKSAMEEINNVPLLHASCRAFKAISKCYLLYGTNVSNQDAIHPFAPLLDPVLLLSKHPSSVFIRLASLKSLIWYIQDSNHLYLISLLKDHLDLDNLIYSNLYEDLLKEIHQRTTEVPSINISVCLLSLIEYQTQVMSSKVNNELIMNIWSTIMSNNLIKDSKYIVLMSLFSIIDIMYRPDSKSSILFIKKSVCYFLGENAVNLCELESNNSNDSDVIPPLMNDIILKLENLVLTWEVQLTCLEALAKIKKLTSNIAVRKHIQEFLAIISQNSKDLSIEPFTLQFVQLS